MIFVRALTKADKKIFARWRNSRFNGDQTFYSRARFIELSASNWSIPRIAKRFSSSTKTVRKWINLFNKYGPEGLQKVIKRRQEYQRISPSHWDISIFDLKKMVSQDASFVINTLVHQ